MNKYTSKLTIIGAVACFVVLFFVIHFWSNISQKILSRQQESLCQELAISNAIQIGKLLKTATSTSKILIEQLSSNSNKWSNVNTVTTVILKNTPELKSIKYSPNNITTHIFPKILNSKYIGQTISAPINNINNPNQLVSFYSEPQLINNEYHIEYHIPVTLNNNHWGYLSYNININVLIKKSALILLDESRYSYQLVNLEQHNKSTILVESSSLLLNSFDSAVIAVGNHKWLLKLSYNVTFNNPLPVVNFLFSVMLSSIFTLIGYLGLSQPSRFRYKNKKLSHEIKSYRLVVEKIMDNVNDEIYISDRNGKVYLYSHNTHDNHHIPDNILLATNEEDYQPKVMFERDGKTKIPPSEHPLNKSLFNNETVLRQVMLSPLNKESYILELYSQPILDELNNSIGALCIGKRIALENTIASNTSRNIILDMLAHNKPINSIFEHIILDIQSNLEGIITSITLIAPQTQKISDIISRDLPSFYVDSLIGLSIDDRVMSNCSAVYRDKLVIVEDIDVHPFWINYKALAKQANLRSCWSQPIHDKNNKVLGTIDLYSDKVYKTNPTTIMSLKEAAILCSLTLERHRDSNGLKRMSLAVEHSSNIVIITDSNGMIEYMNPQYTAVTGYSPIDKLGTLISIFDHKVTQSHIINDINLHLSNGQKWQGEIKGNTKKCGDYWAMVTVTPTMSKSDKINHLVFVLTDVTQINQNINKVYHHSYDPLTSLYNRQTLEHRLQLLLTKSKEDVRIHSLCAININEYNYIHEKYGYQASDNLLQQVSQVLSQQLQKQDTLSRTNADQFFVLMEDCNNDNALSILKELVLRTNGFEFYWSNQTFLISLNIGISEINNKSASIQFIIQEAEQACIEVKNHDMSVMIFDNEKDENKIPLTSDLFWSEQIKQALEHQKFELLMQPIVTLNETSSIQYEVLLRLPNDQNELIKPEVFLPAATRYNLSVNIDRSVVNNIVQWCYQQPNSLTNIEKLYINLSEDSLFDESFSYYLIGLANEYKEVFKYLVFEFSEYHLLSNLSHYRRFTQAIKHTQCQFSIDNFGRGLSSFTYLKNFPITSIKINGDFIKSMINDPFSEATLRSIWHLSRALNIDIIATHVETNDVITHLKEFNINHAQGFLLGKPCALSDI